jgi:hypothetical protein
VMMEQDYICSSAAQTATDLTVGPGWFSALDEALVTAGESGRGIDLQLCMMNPAHAMASTYIHRASNGRGTGDHVVRNAARGLPLGWSGMLLWAVGMWPSRDNVWTNSSINVPGLDNETDPEGQTAMAVFAGGPYGIADIAGAMNRSLLMRSCREDGVLLRPDKPATAIEQSFAASFQDLKPRHVWGTFSQVGSARWTYILSLNLDEPLSVPMATLDDSWSGGWVAFEGWHGIAHGDFLPIDTTGDIKIPASPQISVMTLGHSLWKVAPVLSSGWVFLGEEDKLMGVSRRRKLTWTVGATTLTLSLVAAPGETVKLAVLGPAERHTATRFACIAGAAAAGDVPDGFGDIDVPVKVVCTAGGNVAGGTKCVC